MASSIVQVFLKSVQNSKSKLCPFYTVIRHSSIPPKKKQKRGTIKHRNLIDSTCDSLAARGFLRSYKPYNPDENVSEKVTAICQKVLGDNYESTSELSAPDKFAVLNTCFQELNHSVPNSLLHKIITVNDVIKFYETPVSTTVPFDELKNQNLPPNLHIQYDYVRFNPESDSIFSTSAFPESSTIVTGLKYKEKYKGYKNRLPQYYDNEPFFKKEDAFE